MVIDRSTIDNVAKRLTNEEVTLVQWLLVEQKAVNIGQTRRRSENDTSSFCYVLAS